MAPLPTESSAARRKLMFSPTLAMVSAIASSMVMPPAFAARILSTFAPVSSAASATILTRPWNRSLRATKSVSEFTSTRIPLPDLTATPIRPSAATRPAFLAALDKPFLRSQSTAASRLPPVSLRAALQSIIPAPVWSRSSFTRLALTFAIADRLYTSSAVNSFALAIQLSTRPGSPTSSPTLCAAVGDNSAICWKWKMPRSLSCFSIAGDTPGSFLRSSATPRGPDNCSKPSLFSSAGASSSALRAGNSVDCRFGGEIAIERDGAAGIVVAGNDKGDPVRITIGVDDRGNRNTKPLCFLNGDVFLVGVDHEDEIRQAAHVLYAAERAIKLVAFALQRQAFLLGIALRLV